VPQQEINILLSVCHIE